MGMLEKSLLNGFDGMELRVKWSLLPMIVRQRTFDRSAEPWQSFHALVELRNAIVHLRRRPMPNTAAGLLNIIVKAQYLPRLRSFPVISLARSKAFVKCGLRPAQ